MAFGALAAIYLVCIILSGIVKNQPCCWRNANGAACVQLVAALSALHISDQHYLRSPRTSSWVTCWLATTCILDLATVRTQWLRGGDTALAAMDTVVISLRTICLLLENTDPRTLIAYATVYSPEERAPPLDRVVFAWAYPLLARDYRLELSLDNLLAISTDLKTDKSLDLVPRKFICKP